MESLRDADLGDLVADLGVEGDLLDVVGAGHGDVGAAVDDDDLGPGLKGRSEKQ